MTTLQLPDLGRPDAGTTLISEWIVDTPERQDRASRALLGEWHELSARLRPAAFLQLTCLASADGRVLLTIAQWTSDEAHRAFVRDHRADLISRIDQDIPGIQRPGLVRYRLADTIVPAEGDHNRTNAIIARSDTTTNAAHWAKATATQLRTTPPPGLGTAHTFTTTDNTQALLYAPTTHPIDLPGAQHHRLLGTVEGKADS